MLQQTETNTNWNPISKSWNPESESLTTSIRKREPAILIKIIP